MAHKAMDAQEQTGKVHSLRGIPAAHRVRGRPGVETGGEWRRCGGLVDSAQFHPWAMCDRARTALVPPEVPLESTQQVDIDVYVCWPGACVAGDVDGVLRWISFSEPIRHVPSAQ